MVGIDKKGVNTKYERTLFEYKPKIKKPIDNKKEQLPGAVDVNVNIISHDNQNINVDVDILNLINTTLQNTNDYINFLSNYKHYMLKNSSYNSILVNFLNGDEFKTTVLVASIFYDHFSQLIEIYKDINVNIDERIIKLKDEVDKIDDDLERLAKQLSPIDFIEDSNNDNKLIYDNLQDSKYDVLQEIASLEVEKYQQDNYKEFLIYFANKLNDSIQTTKLVSFTDIDVVLANKHIIFNRGNKNKLKELFDNIVLESNLQLENFEYIIENFLSARDRQKYYTDYINFYKKRPRYIPFIKSFLSENIDQVLDASHLIYQDLTNISDNIDKSYKESFENLVRLSDFLDKMMLKSFVLELKKIRYTILKGVL